MPLSDYSNRIPVIELLKAFDVKSVFDIGIGYGSFGKIISEAIPSCKIYGLEVFAPYIHSVPEGCYDKIFMADMRHFDFYPHSCNACMLIDSLEHIDRGEGLALLERLENTFPLIILSLPIVDYPQGPVLGNDHETHRAQWKQKEIEALGYKMHYTNGSIGVFFKEVSHVAV